MHPRGSTIALPGRALQFSPSPDRAQRRLRFALLAGIPALISGSVLAIVFVPDSGPREISGFEVHGASYLARDEVILLSGLSGKSRASGADLKRAGERLEKHAAVKRADLSFSAGGRVLVRLDERACFALVRNETDGSVVEVDRGLRILSRGALRCQALPIVTGRFGVLGPQALAYKDRRLDATMAGLQRLRSLYPVLLGRISEVRIRRAGGLELYLTGTRLRIRAGSSLDAPTIHRLYSAVAYLEARKLLTGRIDIRGREAIYSR